MKRLAILSTHPIQYNAPLFRLLADHPGIDLKVFYSKVAEEVRYDKDFGQEVTWDIPLTEGYVHSFFAASSASGKKILIKAIEAFQPHAVLVYGWNFDGHFAVMKHFKGKVPVWFRGDSTIIDPMPWGKRVARKLWLRYVYKHIDLAFYVGSANHAYFKWCGLKDDQLRLAPHAVDNAFFQQDDDRRNQDALAIRAQLGISEDAVVFLFVGKLEPIKQPIQLALAFEEFSKNASRVTHLVFVGSGILYSELQSLGSRCPYIHLCGFVNQSLMPTYYRIGDILCLTSFSETWGLVVNEFLASRGGKVIVSDRVGCSMDLIEDGKGYCVSATDFNSWIQEFQKIADEASALTIYVPTPWKQLSTYRDEIVKALE